MNSSASVVLPVPRLAVAEQAQWLATTVRCDSHVDLRQTLFERGVDDAGSPQPLRGRRSQRGDLNLLRQHPAPPGRR